MTSRFLYNFSTLNVWFVGWSWYVRTYYFLSINWIDQGFPWDIFRLYDLMASISWSDRPYGFITVFIPISGCLHRLHESWMHWWLPRWTQTPLGSKLEKWGVGKRGISWCRQCMPNRSLLRSHRLNSLSVHHDLDFAVIFECLRYPILDGASRTLKCECYSRDVDNSDAILHLRMWQLWR